jgi:hypothetical protein
MGGACSTNGRIGLHIGFWWENQRERGCWEDQYVGGWIILRWIIEVGWGDDWIGLAQDRNRWIALVNLVLNLWVS